MPTPDDYRRPELEWHTRLVRTGLRNDDAAMAVDMLRVALDGRNLDDMVGLSPEALADRLGPGPGHTAAILLDAYTQIPEPPPRTQIEPRTTRAPEPIPQAAVEGSPANAYGQGIDQLRRALRSPHPHAESVTILHSTLTLATCPACGQPLLAQAMWVLDPITLEPGEKTGIATSSLEGIRVDHECRPIPQPRHEPAQPLQRGLRPLFGEE